MTPRWEPCLPPEFGFLSCERAVLEGAGLHVTPLDVGGWAWEVHCGTRYRHGTEPTQAVARARARAAVYQLLGFDEDVIAYSTLPVVGLDPLKNKGSEEIDGGR